MHKLEWNRCIHTRGLPESNLIIITYHPLNLCPCMQFTFIGHLWFQILKGGWLRARVSDLVWCWAKCGSEFERSRWPCYFFLLLFLLFFSFTPRTQPQQTPLTPLALPTKSTTTTNTVNSTTSAATTNTTNYHYRQYCYNHHPTINTTTTNTIISTSTINTSMTKTIISITTVKTTTPTPIPSPPPWPSKSLPNAGKSI